MIKTITIIHTSGANRFQLEILIEKLKRIPKDRLNDDLIAFNPYILVPGSPQEIEIVHLIFSMFLSHNHTITEISNLLYA